MSSLFPLHFETGRHPRNSPFLSDEEYSKCLDTLTKMNKLTSVRTNREGNGRKACTDLFVVDAETKQVLLGKRKVQPQPDWWYGAGGRMKPGETPFESAARILKRELGFVLPEEAKRHVKDGGRFMGVGAYSYTWEFREQEPKNNGAADISAVMALEVTKAEIASFKFDSKEYERHDWVDCWTIINDDTKHPALRRSIADLVKAREWEALVQECNRPAEDVALGKKLREFVSKWTETDAILVAAAEDQHKRQKLAAS